MKIVKKVLVIAMVVCIAVTFMPAGSALAMNAATGAKIKTNQSAGAGQSTDSIIKARVFKKVNGRKHYGAWSRTRKI